MTDDDVIYYRLNYKALQIGDVLVEEGDSKFGSVIRRVEGNPFTHALICLGGGQVVEAVQRGVVFLCSARIVTREPARYRQLRYPGITEAQKGAIEATVRSHAFKNYNLRGALGTKAAPIRVQTDGSMFFCSELVTAAYAAAGIAVVAGHTAATVTPNMLLGDGSVLVDVTSADLFERIECFGDDDRRDVEAMSDRDLNIVGTEVDENRETEQTVVKTLKAVIERASNYADGKGRRVDNLAEMLSALTQMKPEHATVLSGRLDEMLRAADYFQIFDRAVARSHIPTWTEELAMLWFSGRQKEAMELVDKAHEMAVLYRETARRMQNDADAISPELASRLSVFGSYKKMLMQNVATLEGYCRTAEQFKLVRDHTFRLPGD